MEGKNEISINEYTENLKENLDKIEENYNNELNEYIEDKVDNSGDLVIAEAKKCLNSIKESKEKNKRHKYSIKEKLATLTLIENNFSLHQIEDIYGIDRKTLRYWISQKDELKKEENQTGYRLKGCGRKPVTNDIENEVMFWINTCRRNGMAVSCAQIIAYAIKLTGKDFKETLNAYRCWVYRFLKRNNLSIRKASHLGQKVPNDMQNLTYKFLYEIIKARKDSEVYDNISLIVNVDETPCYLENPLTETVDIKGKKQIEIVTYGKEKCRLTAVLGVSASGYKLPPLLILKGKIGKKKEKELNNIDIVKNKKNFVKCQENAWCSSEIFLFWINNIFKYCILLNHTFSKLLLYYKIYIVIIFFIF